jgi:O-antigen ligase
MQAFSTTGPVLVDRPRAIVRWLSASLVPKAVIRYAYYGFIFALPFEGAIGGLSRLGLILIGLTFCQPRLFLKPPPKAFWCFVIYFFVVAGLGLFTIMGPQQDTGFTSELITLLFSFFQLLVFFFIAYRLMMFDSIAKRSLLIFGLSCTLLAILELSGFISREVAQDRLTTSFGDNPNVVASVLSLGLLGLLALAYGRKDAGIKLRLLAWLSSAFLLIVIVRTGSRGSQLALGLALIALILKPASIPQKVKIAFIVAAVSASVVWTIYKVDSARERWEASYYEGDVAGRDVLVPVAWEMFLERPIIGWGPVNNGYEMNSRLARPGGLGDPHNLYLWLLLQTGLLGAAPFFIGLWLCCCSVWRARTSAQDSLPLAWLVFMLAINAKGTYLYDKTFWLVLAYALASGSYAVARSEVYLQAVRSRKTTAMSSLP